MVLGVSFFVKFAIDQNWINETGRVMIGLFCGAILIGVAHKLSKNYRSFSSVLVGGGLTIFYFTIALAYHQYHLFSQTASFVIMIVITVFAVLLSILYDRIELGILATIGGFVTPFLVSNGSGNYVVLFSYLCILNTGLIVLAYVKRWRPLNFIGFFFTLIIFGGWLGTSLDKPTFSNSGAFAFATAFYLMFIVMNVIHHAARGSAFKAFDFIILLSINLAYYSAGLIIFQNAGNAEYKGLFTISLGVLNLILAYLFFKKKSTDRNFIYLLIGLTLSFISLTGPIQLKGHYITLFWSTEMVVLFWLYQKSAIKLIKIASLLISFLMLISLVMDLFTVYNESTLVPVIFNKAFVTSIFSSIALCCTYLLFKKEANEFYLKGIQNQSVKITYLTLSIILVLIAGILEINYQFLNRYAETGLAFVYLQLYVVTFFCLLFFILERRGFAIDMELRLILPFIIFVLYLFNASNIYATEQLSLSTQQYALLFSAHWISIIMLLLLAGTTIKYVKKEARLSGGNLELFTGVTVIALVIILSIEVQHVYLWLMYSGKPSINYAENLYSKAGLSIVWGISSFIGIWIGMKYGIKLLRVLALILFGVTIVKLFVYDIKNIPIGGKIAAFILLGVLLLIVSFMYQRLKKLIIDNEKKVE